METVFQTLGVKRSLFLWSFDKPARFSRTQLQPGLLIHMVLVLHLGPGSVPQWGNSTEGTLHARIGSCLLDRFRRYDMI